METEKNGRKNIGQLKTSSGLFSRTLKSSLETVTSFKPVNFIITAEDEGNIQNPGGQVVLKTNGSKTSSVLGFMLFYFQAGIKT